MDWRGTPGSKFGERIRSVESVVFFSLFLCSFICAEDIQFEYGLLHDKAHFRNFICSFQRVLRGRQPKHWIKYSKSSIQWISNQWIQLANKPICFSLWLGWRKTMQALHIWAVLHAAQRLIGGWFDFWCRALFDWTIEDGRKGKIERGRASQNKMVNHFSVSHRIIWAHNAIIHLRP